FIVIFYGAKSKNGGDNIMSNVIPKPYENPVQYVKRTVVDPLVNTANKAHNSGVSQAKSDVTNTKSVVSSALSGTLGYVVARSSTSSPQAALATAVSAGIGAASVAAVGYVDGFGKSVGWWGK